MSRLNYWWGHQTASPLWDNKVVHAMADSVKIGEPKRERTCPICREKLKNTSLFNKHMHDKHIRGKMKPLLRKQKGVTSTA